MSAQDRAIQKLARELAGIKKEVVSWRGPQADYTSIENGGNFTFKDSDGNVTGVFGGQDDGSTTVRHVDGPTPMVPSGLTAHVDGPIIQTEWDGTFEDNATPTLDHSHLEVEATGPGGEKLRGSLNDITGGVVAFTATVSGEWTVVARSVSRAEKRSLDGDAGTVTVELVGLTGAINDAIGSANGKNTVTYAEVAPTPADEGIPGDTWWVGQVGRPNDIIEATNLVFNPSFEVAPSDLALSSGLSSAVQSTDSRGILSGTRCLSVTGAASGITVNSAQVAVYTSPGIEAGEYLGWGWSLLDANAVGLTVSVGVNWYTSGGSFISSEYQSYRTVPTSLGVLSSAFLAPAGTYRARMIVRFRAANGTSAAPAGFSVLTDGWLSCSALSFSGALDAVSTYFDGDSASGLTDDESHYRWTGTPHASTSQKYLPAIVGSGSDVWNITEQWQYTSSGWSAVELSHQVIATVDLGKATVGELDGIRITAQSIRGAQLSGDAIDGKVITGGTYRTTGGTGSWSDDGLFIAQPDGTSMVRFPTDGSSLSLTASDVQIDRASVTDLDLSFGSVRSGGQVTLASGVTAPSSPPELTANWQRAATLQRQEGLPPHAWEALAWWDDGEAWVRTINIFGAESSDPDMIELYDPDTGESVRSFPIGLNPTNGVTIIGDIAYVLGDVYSSSGQKTTWVHGYDLDTGEKVSQFVFPGLQPGRRVALCSTSDGMLVNVVVTVAGNGIAVRTRNPVTGVEDTARSWNAAWPASAGTRLEGAALVGDMLYVTSQDFTRAYEIDGNDLNRVEGSGWTNPNKNGAGMVWRLGLVPYVVDGVGEVYQGASAFPADYTLQACFTWFDGTNETTPSPIAETVGGARNAYTISAPERAGLQRRMYVRPGSSGLWWRFTMPAGTVFGPIGVFGSLTATPPTTNSFPAATPAVLKSSIGGFQVKGDGSGSWGPLTFNADGTMTSTQIPAWVPVTTFLNSASASTFGRAPAYRIWPDGKVEWRGIVSFPATTTTTEFITIPVAARPNTACYFTASGSGARTAALDFCSNEGPTSIRVRFYTANGTLSWFSLDGIYYYLT